MIMNIEKEFRFMQYIKVNQHSLNEYKMAQYRLLERQNRLVECNLWRSYKQWDHYWNLIIKTETKIDILDMMIQYFPLDN